MITDNEIIHIRRLEKEDIEFLRLLRNKHCKSFIYSKTISRIAQEEWYKEYCKKQNDYMYTVFSDSVNCPIAFAALYNIDKKKAEFGRLLVDRTLYSKPGLGKFILKYLINEAKHRLAIDTIYLEVFSNNIAALKTYIYCGFKEVSRKKLDNKELIYMELSL